MNFELLHPADQLVMIMARIYQYGMTTTSGGNLSIKDENGDIWITPSGIDKGTLTRADIMQVKPDGTVIGPHTPSVELPIHRDIYKIRPDLHAIVHAHPPVLVAFSLVRRVPDVTLIPNAALVCGKVALAKYGVPGSEQLGKNIAEKFAEGYNTVLMENHGVVCGAQDLYRAFMAFETLESSAKIELDALKLEVQGMYEKIYADTCYVFYWRERVENEEIGNLVYMAYVSMATGEVYGTSSPDEGNG